MNKDTRILVGLVATVLIYIFIATWTVRASLSLPPAKVELWPLTYWIMTPAWTFPVVGFLFGLILLMVLAAVLGEDEDLLRGFSPIVIGAFLFALPGAVGHEISFLSGTVLVLLALGEFITVSYLVHLLRIGESIELESKWGGLGGGLGGWRMSPAAGLLVLAIALAAAAAASIQPPPNDKDSGSAGAAAVSAGAPEAGKTMPKSANGKP